jgi:hypothetical protein
MKKMGRPRKNGVVGPKHLARALMIVDAYSKARREGSKYSAAVRETVDAIKQSAPGLSISETEVRRVVAECLPRESQIALTAEYSILEGEEAAKHRRSHAVKMEQAGVKGLREMSESDLQKPLKRFIFGYGKKIHYPRHNAKESKS